MIFSPTTQHALRALIHLAKRADAPPVLARQIAAAESIPPAFVSKILLRLRTGGLVKSAKGPGGGYTLARPASSICMSEILEIFDDLQALRTQCALGRGKCDANEQCELHRRWERFRLDFLGGIASLTLDQLSSPLERAARTQATRRAPAKPPRRRSARGGPHITGRRGAH